MTCLPEECEKLCALSYSKLKEVCQQICSGEITIKKLEKISDRLQHMEQLCTAATSENGHENDFEFTKVRAALDQRMLEHQTFNKRKCQLELLCSHITVNVQGKLLKSYYVNSAG